MFCRIKAWEFITKIFLVCAISYTIFGIGDHGYVSVKILRLVINHDAQQLSNAYQLKARIGLIRKLDFPRDDAII
jgi:hypothetical protein